MGRTTSTRWSDHGGHRWRLGSGGAQAGMVRSDRGQKLVAFRLDDEGEVLRVRSSLRRETATAIMGADEAVPSAGRWGGLFERGNPYPGDGTPVCGFPFQRGDKVAQKRSVFPGHLRRTEPATRSSRPAIFADQIRLGSAVLKPPPRRVLFRDSWHESCFAGLQAVDPTGSAAS